MRHRKHKNTLGLKEGHRKAVMNNLARNVITHNRIITTAKKAKVASRFVDKLITLAKRNNLHAQRQLFSYLKSRDMVKYLVKEVAPRFQNRNGGYTRVIRYKNRIGDGALMSILELTEIPEIKETSGKKKKKKEKRKADGAADSEKSSKKKAKKEEVKNAEEKLEQPVEELPVEDGSKKQGFLKNLRGYLKK